MDIKNIQSVSVSLAKFVKNENGDLIPIPIELQQVQKFNNDFNLFEFYAKYFFNSAYALKEVVFNTGDGLELGNVPVFLYLHAFELQLKSILYNINNEGLNTDTFGRKYGHNLNSLLSELEAKGKTWNQGLSITEKDFITKTGNDYKNKLYNYADGVDLSNPLNLDLVKVEELIHKILSNCLE